MPTYTDEITIHGAEFEVTYYYEPSKDPYIDENSYIEIHELYLKTPPKSWLGFFEGLYANLSKQQLPFIEFLENEMREQWDI